MDSFPCYNNGSYDAGLSLDIYSWNKEIWSENQKLSLCLIHNSFISSFARLNAKWDNGLLFTEGIHRLL